MFGHKKGAFTGATADRKGRFEVADKGTIFLDEIGELDLNSQVKLLRVLQEHTFEVLGDSMPRKVDIRVVCATNADLSAMVAERTFREDLFYRINLITVTLPPLRERKSDIPELVNHFARQFGKANRMDIPDITPEAMAYLSQLPYPGNIRELKNLVERTMLINSVPTLDASAFRDAAALSPDTNITNVSASGSLEDIERAAIEKALAKCGGNMSAAAAQLGISRQALYRRMEKFGLST